MSELITSATEHVTHVLADALDTALTPVSERHPSSGLVYFSVFGREFEVEITMRSEGSYLIFGWKGPSSGSGGVNYEEVDDGEDD